MAGGEHVGEGHWLVTDRQTAGRGRLGRQWNDGAGNFMGSTVIHLRAGDPPAASLALVAGVALARSVAALAPGLDARLKWPNDLLIGGAKCAGILMERSGDSIVIGIGVNLAAAPRLPDRPTIALADTGRAVDRDVFAGALAIAMTEALWTWRNDGIAGIAGEWLPRAHPRGTALRVTEQDIDGSFDGLDASGALRLRRADGTVILVHAGDVEIRRDHEEGK